MSSWIKKDAGVIVRYIDGPHDLPVKDGWQKVAYPARQWKLDAMGRVIKKSRADLDADAEPRIRAEADDRQRIYAKAEAVVLAANPAGDPAPMAKWITGLVRRFPDLEEEL